jgi:hypothetical protein
MYAWSSIFLRNLTLRKKFSINIYPRLKKKDYNTVTRMGKSPGRRSARGRRQGGLHLVLEYQICDVTKNQF